MALLSKFEVWKVSKMLLLGFVEVWGDVVPSSELVRRRRRHFLIAVVVGALGLRFGF